MKSQQDLEKTIEQLKLKNSELEDKNATLSQEIASQTQRVEYLTEKQGELVEKLARSEELKERLKNDADSLNSKLILMEQDVFESKTIQLDLLEKLKEMEI